MLPRVQSLFEIRCDHLDHIHPGSLFNGSLLLKPLYISMDTFSIDIGVVPQWFANQVFWR